MPAEPFQLPPVERLGIDLDVAARHGPRDAQPDRRPSDQAVASGASTSVECLTQLVLDRRVDAVERRGICGMERDRVPVRHVGAVARDDAPRIHGTFEAALDLDGLERRMEQPRGRALEQPLEESLNRRKRAHRAAQLSRGRRSNRTIAMGDRYPYVMPPDRRPDDDGVRISERR